MSYGNVATVQPGYNTWQGYGQGATGYGAAANTNTGYGTAAGGYGAAAPSATWGGAQGADPYAAYYAQQQQQQQALQQGMQQAQLTGGYSPAAGFPGGGMSSGIPGMDQFSMAGAGGAAGAPTGMDAAGGAAPMDMSQLANILGEQPNKPAETSKSGSWGWMQIGAAVAALAIGAVGGRLTKSNDKGGNPNVAELPFSTVKGLGDEKKPLVEIKGTDGSVKKYVDLSTGEVYSPDDPALRDLQPATGDAGGNSSS